jgi:hypothetical protein
LDDLDADEEEDESDFFESPLDELSFDADADADLSLPPESPEPEPDRSISRLRRLVP